MKCIFRIDSYGIKLVYETKETNGLTEIKKG